MPTEYDYQITPRTLDLGGGWNLRLLENGEEVGGGVFPLPEYCDLRDEKALKKSVEGIAAAVSQRLGAMPLRCGN